jgi:hypothetical protein
VDSCNRAIICFALVIKDPLVVKKPHSFHIWLLEWIILYVYFEFV